MKALLLIALVSSGFCFGQENPWTPKGENPWKAYPQQETKPVEVIDSVRLVDAGADSTTLPIKPKENNWEAEVAYAKGEQRATQVYKSGGDFAFGFVTGVCFNMFGLVTDLVYIVPDFKREKKVVDKVVQEVQNENCDKKLLRKKVKKKVKSKKAISTIAGTLTGAFTQVGIAIVLILM